MTAELSVLKLGDEVYSESLQHIVPSYRGGFPQRETQLYGRFRTVKIDRLSHQTLLNNGSAGGVQQLVRHHLAAGIYDLILIDNPLSILALEANVETQLQTPIVFDCIDWYAEMYAAEFNDPAGTALLESSFQEAVRRSSAVIAQSPLMLRAVQSLRTPLPSLLIPNGYDEEYFRPADAAAQSVARRCIEEKHGVSLAGRRVLAYTGKIGTWYSGLVEVIAALDPERDLLLLVGDGPLLPHLPHSPAVLRCGAVPLAEVPMYTTAADLLVFPLGTDCSPIVLSEYFAIGKPVVAPQGRIEWLLRNGLNGVIVDGTPAGWRSGFDRAAFLTDTAREANQRLARRLTWSGLAARMEEFLHNIAVPGHRVPAELEGEVHA